MNASLIMSNALFVLQRTIIFPFVASSMIMRVFIVSYRILSQLFLKRKYPQYCCIRVFPKKKKVMDIPIKLDFCLFGVLVVEETVIKLWTSYSLCPRCSGKLLQLLYASSLFRISIDHHYFSLYNFHVKRRELLLAFIFLFSVNGRRVIYRSWRFIGEVSAMSWVVLRLPMLRLLILSLTQFLARPPCFWSIL